VAEVLALADAVPARHRAMVLVTTFGSLRFGEVTLERRDINLAAGTIEVRRAFVEVRGKGLVAGPPKSRAGLRWVSLPHAVVVELRKHLVAYVEAEPSSLVFTGPKGAPIRRGNARKLLRWNDALAAVGVTGVRFHDLRHTGNTLAARSGVSTRDLMTRMGHDSVRAAIIYQQATTEADARIAGSLYADIASANDGGVATDEGDDGDGVVVPLR
jgi:integrase